mgnify:CR=1 FL=1
MKPLPINKRLLSPRAARAALWIEANGRCQLCDCELNESWAADHVTPFLISGRTNPHEMQALCIPCNSRKGSALEVKNGK